MLGSIRGQIALKTEKFLLIETGGVGYRVFTTSDLLNESKNGSVVYLFLHTHVREDALDLYGFATQKDLDFFELLLGVSGIGPRGAIGILNVASVATICKAIRTNDIAYLTKISGIGRKTAEKIVLELRDKVGDLNGENGLDNSDLDVLEALKSLGYREPEIRDALRQIDMEKNTNSKIKEALKILGKK